MARIFVIQTDDELRGEDVPAIRRVLTRHYGLGDEEAERAIERLVTQAAAGTAESADVELKRLLSDGGA